MHEIFDELESVVPARAGMSPRHLKGLIIDEGGPRASGDEPAAAHAGAISTGWSPRERG